MRTGNIIEFHNYISEEAELLKFVLVLLLNFIITLVKKLNYSSWFLLEILMIFF